MLGPVTWDGSVATMTGIAARTSSLHEWPMFNDEQFNNKRSSNIGVNFNQVGRDGTGMAAKTATSGNIFGGTMPDWPLDEFFGFNEFGGGFGFPEHGSSKVCILLDLGIFILTYQWSATFFQVRSCVPIYVIIFYFLMIRAVLSCFGDLGLGQTLGLK